MALPITSQDISRGAEEFGYQARTVRLKRLGELRQEIEDRHARGEFDKGFYQEWLTGFQFVPPEDLPDARSLIIVAIPHPQTEVRFHWNGVVVPLIIPPTYLCDVAFRQQVMDKLGKLLSPYGYRLTPANVPKKLLAVRSGLAAYGKNNITYVDGMGSFHRLEAFFSDYPCEKDHWREAQMLEFCHNCSACQRHCPTGAIAGDRFLLHAERCLTFHNEHDANIAFPDWIDRSWHNSLVGCMRCQLSCPQDKNYWQWVESGAEFTSQETAMLLAGVPLEKMPAQTAQKLEQSGMTYLLDTLSRNLEVHISA